MLASMGGLVCGTIILVFLLGGGQVILALIIAAVMVLSGIAEITPAVILGCLIVLVLKATFNGGDRRDRGAEDREVRNALLILEEGERYLRRKAEESLLSRSPTYDAWYNQNFGNVAPDQWNKDQWSKDEMYKLIPEI